MSISRPRGPLSFDSRENAVIIFDWDDTLCPTWWGSSASGSDGTDVREDIVQHRRELEEHAQVVVQLLRAAREVARVALVTLANQEWLVCSMERLFPGHDMQALFTELEIEVYHAVINRRSGSGEGDHRVQAKKRAMQKCISSLYKFRNSETRMNVISIGDSTIEKEAIKELLKEASGTPVCKTLKLPSDPTLDQLTHQLKLLLPYLGRMVAHGKDIDWSSTSFMFGW